MSTTFFVGKMPLFESASGINAINASFYEVHGDLYCPNAGQFHLLLMNAYVCEFNALWIRFRPNVCSMQSHCILLPSYVTLLAYTSPLPNHLVRYQLLLRRRVPIF